MPAGGEKVFAHVKVPIAATTLHIFDAGASAHSGDAAAVRVRVRVKGTTASLFDS